MPDGARRAHRRAERNAPDERRRPGRPGVPDRRADARGLLPRPGRPRAGDRTVARLRAVRRHPLVRDLDARHGRGPRVRPGDPRALPRQAARLQLLALVQLAQPARRRRRSRPSRTSSARWATASSSSRWPASTRSTSRCSSSRTATRATRHDRLRRLFRSASSSSRSTGTPRPATSARSAPATSTPCSRRSARARRSRSRARPKKRSSRREPCRDDARGRRAPRPGDDEVLAPDALEFVARLHRELNPAGSSCSSDAASARPSSTPAPCRSSWPRRRCARERLAASRRHRPTCATGVSRSRARSTAR